MNKKRQRLLGKLGEHYAKERVRVDGERKKQKVLDDELDALLERGGRLQERIAGCGRAEGMASQFQPDSADSTTSPAIEVGSMGAEAGGHVSGALGHSDVLGESDQLLRDLELDTLQWHGVGAEDDRDGPSI